MYDEKWLERFFNALEKNADWLEIVLPGDYVTTEPPLGKVYLPTASYREMSEWAFPVQAQIELFDAEKAFEGDGRLDALKPFIRGGFWRNFLTKYPESNNMYRRMFMVSKEVDAARRKPSYREAVRELYRAQCNCGYWHGVFGGLYLNFLRRAIYEHLIKAECLVSNMSPGTEIFDFDGDGHDEVILGNDALKLFVAPRQGGTALELDYFPKAFNIFDTMTRREEAYHRQIPDSSETDENEHASIHDGIRSKEDDIRSYLHYDRYRRLNFIDHFLPHDESLDSFSENRHTELGDFVEAQYERTQVKKKGGLGITLGRQGTLRINGERLPVNIQKQFTLPEKGVSLSVDYRLDFNSKPNNVMFGVELNLGLGSGYADDSSISIPGRYLSDPHLASTGVEEDVRDIVLTIGWMPLIIKMKLSRPATLWRFPIETVSQSEGGVERTYQNTCLVPVWNLEDSGREFEVNITMGVE